MGSDPKYSDPGFRFCAIIMAMNSPILQYIIWFLVTVLYSPIFFQLYRSRWEMIDYTHAYFILPVSLWLIWRKRKTLATLLSTPTFLQNALNLALILISFLFFITGWRHDYLALTTFSLITLLFGLNGFLYGSKVVKALSFPFLYLLLMVPPPLGILDSITLPMRKGISILTEMILKGLHYPITRDGLLLSMGGHDIYMGAPCSGFRSLITMIALGLAYTYVIKGSLKKKALLFTSVIPLALIGNLLRVMGMCLVTFYFGDTIGQHFHDISGYAIFALLILGLIGLESFLERVMK